MELESREENPELATFRSIRFYMLLRTSPVSASSQDTTTPFAALYSCRLLWVDLAIACP